MACPISPVDEVVLLQIFAATSNVPGYVQQVLHHQSGWLILDKSQIHIGEKRRKAMGWGREYWKNIIVGEIGNRRRERERHTEAGRRK